MIQTLKDIIEEKLGESDFDVDISDNPQRGNLSTNAAFILAKEEGKSPMDTAEDLRSYIRKHAPSGFIEKIEIAEPGFINIRLTKEALQGEFKKIAKNTWGKEKKNKKTIIVEYSSPNIAKPLHIGHIRSAVIGDALANVFDFAGYNVVRWNYIGDWGTQFGKVIVAYKLWGKRREVNKEPVGELGRLYTKFHDEAKDHPELEVHGREEFKKLEDGDRENVKLWKWFRKESLKELSKIYNKLGIRFSVFIGEAFYQKNLKDTIEDLVEKGIAKESEGALIIPLDKYSLPPGMVRKSDGATVYLTRDIPNLKYRLDEYNPEKILYVIGNEQSLHLSQLFAIAKEMDMGEGVDLEYIKYGLILGEDGKRFATREGGVVELKQVLDKSVELSEKIFRERKTSLNKRELKAAVRAIGIGAVKYNGLAQNRLSDIVFDWDKMLSLEGDSAPYLQYTYARLKSILRKAKEVPKLDVSQLEDDHDLVIVMKLAEFPSVLENVRENYMPHYLALYLYELAKDINAFYHSEPVLYSEPKLRAVRLNLVKATANTLKTGLRLLGIETLEKM